MTEINLQLLFKVREIAEQAGEAILNIYQNADFNIQIKSDNTPLTEADLAAHWVIAKGLRKISDWPVLSEESPADDLEKHLQWQRYWLVDPLDGTKEFIDRNGEFTVNIALIDQGKPILGVIYAPVHCVSYCGLQDKGSWKASNHIDFDQWTRLHSRSWNPQQQKTLVASSRRHGAEKLVQRLQAIGDYDFLAMGSSLKTCLVAEGIADFYPRIGPTSEWDTGAAQCILEQAGGAILGPDFASLKYNQKQSLLNPNFIAVGDKSVNWQEWLTLEG